MGIVVFMMLQRQFFCYGFSHTHVNNNQNLDLFIFLGCIPQNNSVFSNLCVIVRHNVQGLKNPQIQSSPSHLRWIILYVVMFLCQINERHAHMRYFPPSHTSYHYIVCYIQCHILFGITQCYYPLLWILFLTKDLIGCMGILQLK